VASSDCTKERSRSMFWGRSRAFELEKRSIDSDETVQFVGGKKRDNTITGEKDSLERKESSWMIKQKGHN